MTTHFDDSARESITSNMSSMKGGNSANNGSDLDKNNILKATFDTLTEEDHKAFEAYCVNLEERHGTVLKNTTPIIFHRPKVIPEVRPDPSFSHNDIQYMINSALKKQAKSTDELLRRLIEERVGKNLIILALILLLLFALLVLLKPIHTQVVHQRQHFNAQPLSPAGEPLSQSNHHRGFGSYFRGPATNYDQHVRARVYASRI
jgi:hypothetical protein